MEWSNRKATNGFRPSALRAAVCGLAVFLPGLATGCSVTGSWKRVSVSPPGAPFPLEYVTFGKDRRYTATWKENGREHTSTGVYKANLLTLDVAEDGYQPRRYRLKRRWDGKLLLIYDADGHSVTATLERAPPPK
ncbi:MAG: hypothetical protein D6788_00835 [Planctomycetota bacterium]|nr:MAG: hypothetical protein D6788_00835 [Planctomycetota bacterium]